jgi:hypothetical protein
MTFLPGKPLPRRTFLRGVGTVLALPLMDAMVPTFAFGGTRALRSGPARRFQAFYVPNGMAMPYWSPSGEGTALELSPILEPLEPFKDQLLQLSGIYANWVQIHAGASGSFLTGVARGGRNELEIVADVSMDQLLANDLGRETQLPSLELSMDAPANAGACSSNLSCVYTHTLSWRSPTQPLPTEYNPRAVFERLFGDSGTTERAARERRMRQQKSILDAVTDKLAHLSAQLGPEDRIRLEGHTDAVRAIERRIQLAEDQIDMELPVVPQPEGVPSDFEEHMDLMLDLQVMAFQLDLTRVISFMVGKEQSARPYPHIGVPEAHHPLSHHSNHPDLVEQMSRINRYHAQLFAGYLRKLRETPDGDGNLLDNMIILYGSGISNSSAHSGDNLPLLVAGGAAGRIKGGRHLSYSDAPTMANLLVTLMDKMDVPVDRVGASTGALPIDALSGV